MAQNRARMPINGGSRALWHKCTRRHEGGQRKSRTVEWYALLPVEGGSRARGVQFRARLHGDNNARKGRHTPNPGRTEKVADEGKADACLIEQYGLLLTNGSTRVKKKPCRDEPCKSACTASRRWYILGLTAEAAHK